MPFYFFFYQGEALVSSSKKKKTQGSWIVQLNSEFRFSQNICKLTSSAFLSKFRDRSNRFLIETVWWRPVYARWLAGQVRDTKVTLSTELGTSTRFSSKNLRTITPMLNCTFFSIRFEKEVNALLEQEE